MTTNTNIKTDEFNPVDECEIPEIAEMIRDEEISKEFASRYIYHYSHILSGRSRTNKYDPKTDSRFWFETELFGQTITYSIPVGDYPVLVASFKVQDSEDIVHTMHYSLSKMMEPIFEHHLNDMLHPPRENRHEVHQRTSFTSRLLD